MLVVLTFACSSMLVASTNTAHSPVAEQLYWRKQAEKRRSSKAAEEGNYQNAREHAKAMASELKREGASIQSELIVAEDGPPAPPPPPPWWLGKRDYIILSAAAALLAALSGFTLIRHRREAEIRKLSGGYLSDGTEVAKFTMPDWFAPAPVAGQADSILLPETPVATAEAAPAPLPVSDAVARFFADAPDTLAAIRAALKDIVGTEKPEERTAILLQLHVLVTDISRKANCWDLRPAWQLSSALELLIKRLADKPQDATPSALRAINAAVDLLHELCVPGVRPNLIIDPPPRILAVDDEALCLRALTFALQKANVTPDTASTGEKAVELATQKPYDVIFMDINMPGMDGLAACMNIRTTKLNEDTPIVFVTVHSDFSMRARTIALGGTDFMAKPFLVFEMCVKAMTLLMRKRLDAARPKRTLLMAPPPKTTVMAESAAKSSAPQATPADAPEPVSAPAITTAAPIAT